MPLKNTNFPVSVRKCFTQDFWDLRSRNILCFVRISFAKSATFRFRGNKVWKNALCSASVSFNRQFKTRRTYARRIIPTAWSFGLCGRVVWRWRRWVPLKRWFTTYKSTRPHTRKTVHTFTAVKVLNPTRILFANNQVEIKQTGSVVIIIYNFN
jgi:hypothetical protein